MSGDGSQPAVMVVDDDPAACSIVEHALARSGFRPVVVQSGDEALRTLYASRPAAVVLETELPVRDGWELLREIRTLSETPVIMLSRSTGEDAVVRALDLGADDFVAKPVRSGELVARLRACLRRSGPDGSFEAYSDAWLSIDQRSMTVTAAGQEIPVTPLEYRLLQALVTNRDRVLSAVQLIELAWGGQDLDANRVRIMMSQLRQKFRRAGTELPIETVRGSGYRYQPAPRSL